MVDLMTVIEPEDAEGAIKGEIHKDDVQTAELYQPEGYHHIPEANAQALMLLVGGNASHQVIVAPQNRSVKLETSPGETVVYAVKDQQIVSQLTLAGDGTVEIKANSIKLNGDSKFLVTHKELDEKLQSFVKALNTAIKTAVAGIPYTWTDVSLDISGTATSTVKTGG